MTTFTADELARLLGRPPRPPLTGDERVPYRGARVLITGAGGSIGSELAREIAACEPAAIGLLDHSELALFTIERELAARAPHLDIRGYLADVTRRASVRRAVGDLSPDVIFHAAAYKHVTMAERAPDAAALVNVVGTAFTAEAAADVNARFVLISSDKAADPASIMGATKRLAEMVVLSTASARFRPIVVRFGNVLGSSGSVLPILRESVRRGEAVPVTDPDATRYFMTAAEAVALVFRADRIARSPEVFWLDMGRPVRLGDLVSRLVAIEHELGFPSVPIDVIGLRPGEKRNETLVDPRLTFARTVDRRIRVARDRAARRVDGRRVVHALHRAGVTADAARTLAILELDVHGFAPSAEARRLAIRSAAVRLVDAREGRRRSGKRSSAA